MKSNFLLRLSEHLWCYAAMPFAVVYLLYIHFGNMKVNLSQLNKK